MGFALPRAQPSLLHVQNMHFSTWPAVLPVPLTVWVLSECSVKYCFSRAPAGDCLFALDAFAADTASSWSRYCNSASLSFLYV